MTFLEEEEVFPILNDVVSAKEEVVKEETNDTAPVAEAKHNGKRKEPEIPVEKKVSYLFLFYFLLPLHLKAVIMSYNWKHAFPFIHSFLISYYKWVCPSEFLFYIFWLYNVGLAVIFLV